MLNHLPEITQIVRYRYLPALISIRSSHVRHYFTSFQLRQEKGIPILNVRESQIFSQEVKETIALQPSCRSHWKSSCDSSCLIFKKNNLSQSVYFLKLYR